MVKEVLLACVGKPSAGKSSFLNAGTFKAPHVTVTNQEQVLTFDMQCPMLLPKSVRMWISTL